MCRLANFAHSGRYDTQDGVRGSALVGVHKQRITRSVFVHGRTSDSFCHRQPCLLLPKATKYSFTNLVLLIKRHVPSLRSPTSQPPEHYI